MPARKKRVEVPGPLRAQVLFASDRTCCKCRDKHKGVQIHHIDENPANNVFENLAVLCLECHNETQIRGGFHQKLDAEQIILYRDNWLAQVSKQRASSFERLPENEREDQRVDLVLATSLVEIYREREEYELLAMHYLVIGNNELRDKYIELAIKQGMDDEGIIFFRSEQDRLDLVPEEVKNRQIKRLEDREDWLLLGRLYRTLKEYQLSVQVTCKGVIKELEEGNIFSAAYSLKEMNKERVVEQLFIDALEKAHERNDLWWQYRAFQELEWDDEAMEFLLEHREEIEEAGEPHFLVQLAIALGDEQQYIEMRKKEAIAESARLDTDVDIPPESAK